MSTIKSYLPVINRAGDANTTFAHLGHVKPSAKSYGLWQTWVLYWPNEGDWWDGEVQFKRWR